MQKLNFALSILVLPFAFHSIQAQLGETRTGTATISGRVTLKGEPARGVEVVIIWNRDIRPTANAPRARSDENGRFSFTGVAAGNYSISAVAPGYVSANETGIWGGRMLSVADGARVEDVDFEIKRGGVIAGRISDSKGSPVIEETITLKKIDRDNKPQSYHPSSPNYHMFGTDDRGVYRIYGLPEGRYLVSVGQTPGSGVSSSRAFYPRVFYPNANSESEAKLIEVSEGSVTTDVDITVSDPKEARDVSGRVVDAGTGQLVEGVRIEVSGVSSDGSLGGAGIESESGPNGAFRVAGLAPGKYALLTQSGWNKGFVSDPVIVDVSEGDATGIELKVRRDAASISGVVVIEGTNDPKVLAKLSQVGVGADIDLADSKLQSRVNIRSVRINADGSFRLSGLPAGKARIYCCDQYDLRVARIERNGAPVDEEIEIDAGEQVTGVSVVSLYGALTLRGEMKIVGGTLPAGYGFHAGAFRTDQNAQYRQWALIDERGQFAFENLAPGAYEIGIYPFTQDASHFSPEIRERFSSVKQKVVVSSGNQQPVTLVVDLSRKEEEQ
jgi:protocatechuate 3,4-dioxygenase beta subunit